MGDIFSCTPRIYFSILQQNPRIIDIQIHANIFDCLTETPVIVQKQCKELSKRKTATYLDRRLYVRPAWALT